MAAANNVLSSPTPTSFPEVFEADEFAKKLHVSERWIAEHSRKKRDPLPHFRRGRVRLYSFSPAFIAWWNRHSVGQQA